MPKPNLIAPPQGATIDQLRRLFRRGQLVVVRYGSSGTQMARVESDLTLRRSHGVQSYQVKVKKYRASSRRWTHPVWISATELLGVPAAGEPGDPADLL